MAMDVREKLVELLTDDMPRCGNLPRWDNPLQLSCDEQVQRIADHLIMNGVTVQETARHCVDGKPVTNADRIRAMSDEELAMCLYEIGYDEGWDKPEYALKWLQQSSEEG